MFIDINFFFFDPQIFNCLFFNHLISNNYINLNLFLIILLRS